MTTPNYKTSKNINFLRSLIEERDAKILELEQTINTLNNQLSSVANKRDISHDDLKEYVLNTKWTYNNLRTAFLGSIYLLYQLNK